VEYRVMRRLPEILLTERPMIKQIRRDDPVSLSSGGEIR